jgi:hypothetical protein
LRLNNIFEKKKKTNETDQDFNVTFSSSGASRLLALVLMFDVADCASDAS